MTDLFDDVDVYEDISFAEGCHLIWGFTLEPWDVTGSTVVFILNGTPFTMSTEVVGESSQFSITLTPVQTSSLALVKRGDIGSYVVRETFPDGTVQQISNGEVIVT